MDIEGRSHIVFREYFVQSSFMVPGISIHAPGQVTHAGRRHQGYEKVEIIR